MAGKQLELEAKLEDPQEAWNKFTNAAHKVLTTPKPVEEKRSTGTAKKRKPVESKIQPSS